MRRPTLRIPALALVAALALAALALPGCGSTGSTGSTGSAAEGLQGAALPAGILAPGFTLSDEHGRPVSLAEYRGQVVVIAFLYSGCAHACVLIAQQIRGALDDLPRPVPVLIVSVDPAADTPARVSAFLRAVALSGRVRYLAGPSPALEAVWRAYRITTPASGRAAFERAATVLLLDGRGAERVLYQQEQLTPEALAHDIGVLRAG